MFRIGTVSKAHGTRGEVVVITDSGLPPSSDEVLYLKNERGDFVPVRIIEIRTIEKSNKISFFVLFTGINNRTEAESVREFGLYSETEPPADEYFADNLPDCEGYLLNDQHGSPVGTVAEVMDNPAHPLLRIVRSGYPDFLIPAVSEYIEMIDHDAETVTAKNLTGLMDL
jgi:16S rRNA processing protein RimM